MSEAGKEMVEGNPAGDLGSQTSSCGDPEVLQLRRSHKNRLESVSSSNRRDEEVPESCRLLDILRRDLIAADVQLSLFIASATTYRQDSSLSPFPPMFISTGGAKDIQGLQSAIREIPPIAVLKRQLENNSWQLSAKLLQLLLWVLSGGQSQLNLRSLSKEEAREKLRLAGGHLAATCPLPDHVFEVRTANTDRWLSESEGSELFYGFHGSRLDNWHSILHHGLQQHRAKNSLFGEGIYLSCELGVSLSFSCRGLGWQASQLGSCLSCVCLAQIRQHESVKIHSEDPSRGRVEGSEGGHVPEKYILVRNNDLLHIRYLLVYGHGTAPALPSARSRLHAWLHSNRMMLLLAGYGLLLLAVGLSNSVWVRRWLRKYGLAH